MAENVKPDRQNCFVIMPIGDESSDTRRRSDQVLKHIIKPAAESCGYHAIRADEIDKPGLITSQVIQRVIDDPLVIADLSETNPNVFYELAIRHAIRKPLVQIIEKGQRIPFDVAGTRTVHVDHKDLDSVSNAKEEIIRQIKQLEADPSDLETPISVSQDLAILKMSDNPKDRGMADILSAISDVRAEQTKLSEGVDKNSVEVIAFAARRLEGLLDSGDGFFRRRPPLRHLSRMIPELMFEGQESSNPFIAVAFAATLYKDAMPWVYEIGMEAYRQLTFGDKTSGRLALKDFREAARFSGHPSARDFFRGDKESIFLGEEVEHMMQALQYRFDERSPETKSKKSTKTE